MIQYSEHIFELRVNTPGQGSGELHSGVLANYICRSFSCKHYKIQVFTARFSQQLLNWEMRPESPKQATARIKLPARHSHGFVNLLNHKWQLEQILRSNVLQVADKNRQNIGLKFDVVVRVINKYSGGDLRLRIKKG